MTIEITGATNGELVKVGDPWWMPPHYGCSNESYMENTTGGTVLELRHGRPYRIQCTVCKAIHTNAWE
jgi:hypothetical protein